MSIIISQVAVVRGLGGCSTGYLTHRYNFRGDMATWAMDGVACACLLTAGICCALASFCADF